MTRPFRVLTRSRDTLAPSTKAEWLPTGSDFLSVMRGHGGVSLREVVKRSLEVARSALLSEGTGNLVCSIMSWWGTTDSVGLFE